MNSAKIVLVLIVAMVGAVAVLFGLAFIHDNLEVSSFPIPAHFTTVDSEQISESPYQCYHPAGSAFLAKFSNGETLLFQTNTGDNMLPTLSFPPGLTILRPNAKFGAIWEKERLSLALKFADGRDAGTLQVVLWQGHLFWRILAPGGKVQSLDSPLASFLRKIRRCK